MDEKLKYWKNNSESYYIKHPTESWAVFMINDVGDLMINSDWGCLYFAWRSFGSGFKNFLSGLDEGYWKSKMATNLLNIRVPAKEITRIVNHVWPIFKEFQLLLRLEETGSISIEIKATL